MADLHGWLVIDKPLGMGSTPVVGAVKRALRDAGHGKVKVGHGGTLDPLATGVLPIAVGEATKLAGRMLDSDKVYRFTICFGEQTDTLDLEGKVITKSDVRPTWAQIEAVLPRFTGSIEQVPPAYSAIKVDGERAYDLARAGQAVELKSRSVTIHSLQLHHWDMPNDPAQTYNSINIAAHVSKGTYIRSLARDIAHALGTVGHVTMLRRTKAGPFGLTEAITLDNLCEAATRGEVSGLCLPLETALDGIPALLLSSVQAGLLRQGRILDGIAVTDGFHLARDGQVPVALVEAIAGSVRVVRGFNL